MLIDDIRTELEINDTSKDNIINRYINQGKLKIKNYLHFATLSDIEKIEGIEDILFDYVITIFNTRGYEGFKQYSEGGMSVTLDNGLPENIKALLPKPTPQIVMK